MALIKPQTLAYSQTVLQHHLKYFAIISAAIGFKLAAPNSLLSEQAVLTELGPFNEGFAKRKAEIIVIDKEHAPLPLLDPKRWRYFKASPEYWQKQGLPILPDAFDFRFFQQAPRLQQRADFIPAESYELILRGHKIAGTLPQQNIRLVLADRKYKSMEQTIRYDSFFVFPEAATGVLVARSCFEVSDIHMNEWPHILLTLDDPGQPQTLAMLEKNFSKPSLPKARATAVVLGSKKKLSLNTLPAGSGPVTDADFQNLDFSSRKFSDRTFINCNFSAVSFAGSELSRLTFLNCWFTKCDFRDVQVKNCKWVDTQLEDLLATHSLWQQTQIVGGSWRRLDLQHATFEKLSGQNLTIIDSDLRHTTAQKLMLNGKKMAFVRIDLSHAKWETPNLMESWWYRVKMDQTHLKKAECSKAKIIRCELKATNLAEAQFGDTYFLQTLIDASNLANCQFTGAAFKRSKIESCALDGIDFKHVSFQEVPLKRDLHKAPPLKTQKRMR